MKKLIHLIPSASVRYAIKEVSVPQISSSTPIQITSHLDMGLMLGKYNLTAKVFRIWCRTWVHSPGRFFVANEMKLMMAHLILEYDFKTEKEGVRPLNVAAGFTVLPDREATILFRRRTIWRWSPWHNHFALYLYYVICKNTFSTTPWRRIFINILQWFCSSLETVL